MTGEPGEAFSDLECDVISIIEEGGEELVELARELIRFDTTARDLGDAPRDEAKLQGYVADRLRSAGADVEVWEPRDGELAGSRQVPPEISFEGRPQLVARFRGGGGPSLLFNGHIDVVSAEPKSAWASDPNEPRVGGDRLYGRGACDMKGGVASMVFAAETLGRLGVQLGGELIVNTVTDEEWNGAGGLASVAHGVAADAGLAPEPTNFDPWIACRGILTPTISVPGRPGHAEVPQPDWRQGGAVNAIEKSMLVLEAVQDVRRAWRASYGDATTLLEPGDAVPTLISGGEWWVSYPSSCTITLDVTYLTAQVDADGWGGAVQRDLEERVLARTAEDAWLAAHPPVFNWGTDLPPAAIPADDPIVELALGVGSSLGHPGTVSAMHSWHDPATFTRSGTPSMSYGPSGLSDSGVPLLHAIDESVRIDDLVACAKAYAVIAIRHTGTTA